MLHRVVAEHRGGFDPNRELHVTPDVLAAVITATRAHGFAFVTLDEALDRLRTGSAAAPFACLTFDDGYRDNFELALPVCSRLDAPFTVYVTTGFIDRSADIWWYAVEVLLREVDRIAIDGADVPAATTAEKAAAFGRLATRLRAAGPAAARALLDDLAARHGTEFRDAAAALAMDWVMVDALDRSVVGAVEAHGVTHAALARLDPAEARAEAAESRRLLEARLGRPVRHFAFPFGDPPSAGARDFALCGELGFASAVTTRFGNIGPGSAAAPWSLPRVPVNGFDDARTVAVKVSGMAAWLRRLAG